MKSIYSRFRRLGIRKKLMVVILTLLTVFAVVGYSATHYMLLVYDDILYNQSAEILNSFSSNIESELSKMDRLSNSLAVVTDPGMQEDIETLFSQDWTYNWLTSFLDLSVKLAAAGDSEPYIISIHLINGQDKEYVYGRYTDKLMPQRKEEILELIGQSKGEHVWFEPSETDKSLISAREIRIIQNNNFVTSGVLVVRIHLEKLVEQVSRGSAKYLSNLIILSQDHMVYIREKQEEFNLAPFYELNNIRNQPYFTKNVQGQKSFVSLMRSPYTNWTYLHILPYSTIFDRIITMRVVIIGIFILMLAFSLMIGAKFAGSLTKPLIKLRDQMDRVKSGDFQVDYIPKPSIDDKDEIKHLQHDFALMIQQINDLIEENYMKEILITKAELKALQAQINPHFLYNTLEIIKWLARAGKPQDVSNVVESLGHLFRASIGSMDGVISLHEELDLLKWYLNIQEYRYDERLRVIIDIQGDMLFAQIPKMTLQPLVENAINYALGQMEGVCIIRIRYDSGKSWDELIVEDNGPGIESNVIEQIVNGTLKPKGTGIGLMNIDNRLKLIFGSEYGLYINGESGTGTQISLKLPKKGERNNV
jgi:two-component system sensor histidine kinase YesM